MTVAHTWFDRKIETCDTTENFAGSSDAQSRDETETALLRIAALCNRAEFKPGQANVPVLRRECTGDASEIALLKFSELALGNIIAFRQHSPKIAEIPFNSSESILIAV